MVQRFKDRPFAFVGINSDEDREVLEEKLAEFGVNWRNAVDGSTSGPIASRWNVIGWPTTYVLDAKGVIRAVDPTHEELDATVEKLLKETEKG